MFLDMMRRFTYILMVVVLFACNSEQDKVMERETTYYLHRAGYEPVYGEVTFTEMDPGKVKVHIQLENTDARYNFPAHLHFGAINEVGDLAFQLEDVNGATGTSTTILDRAKLENGEIFTYSHLESMNGSVKIHLSSELFRHVVLCYGNVGTNENYATDGVTICTGH